MTMRSLHLKLLMSATLVVAIMVAVPLVGLTAEESDGTSGVVIDFGYWDVTWTELTFREGSDGFDALELACDLNGYELVYRDQEARAVSSIDGQGNLVGKIWGMYILDEGSWTPVEDPSSIDVRDVRLVCWARASDATDVVPGSDDTGFTYYSYARDGVSLNTGEKLRVVTLAPSITEMVCSLGGIDLIVGTDVYSDHPSEVVERRESGEIERIGGYTDPNYEWIVRLGPDIVFCDGGTGEHVSMADKLRKSGIDCVVLYDATDVEKLYDNLWIVASSMGLSSNANDVISAERSTMDNITGVIGVQSERRVFVSLSVSPSPWTSGSDTYMSDLIDRAGSMNVFDSQASSWFMVSKEQIYAKQPNVIVVIYDGHEITSEEEYQSILDSMDPVWRQTPAFRNGEVYIFSGDAADILSRPGPRLSEAAELLAKAFFPSQFTDRDPLDTIPKYLGDDYSDYLRYQRSV